MGIFRRIRSLFTKDKNNDPLFEQSELEKKEWQDPFKTTEEIPEEVKNISEEEAVPATRDKARDFTEKLGEDVIEKADELYEKGKEKLSELSEKGKEKAESLKEKVQETYDELYEKAKKQKEIDDKTPDYGEETHAEKLRKTDLLEGSDDFFSKAEKFAEGDYSAAREGKVDIQSSEDEKNEKDVKQDGKVAGFEDRDGDGDELIDDAEIEDEK